MSQLQVEDVEAIAARRAKRGMKYLRENVKKKRFKRVRPKRIRIERDDECVLGQMFGRYSRGKRKLGLNNKDVVRLGFLGDDKVRTEQLTAPWRQLFH